MNIADRINEVIDGLTGNPAAHQWIADLEDIRAGVDELTAAAWACTQAKQDRAADVAELIEAAELASDTASTEWQGANGVRMGATGSDGNRLHFVSAHVMENLRAALAAMGGKV